MCRWNAYIGEPLMLDELLFRTEHGLIDQSLHSRMGAETTNGDGFGLGWYVAGMDDAPGRYRSVEPAWNDANLRDLARHVESPLFLAHIRAAIGSPVQQTNCHPYRHGRWLFVHNGFLNGFKRDAPGPGARDRAVAVQLRSPARPTPSCCSTSPSPSGSRTTRSAQSSGPSGSSRRPPSATASSLPCR